MVSMGSGLMVYVALVPRLSTCKFATKDTRHQDELSSQQQRQRK